MPSEIVSAMERFFVAFATYRTLCGSDALGDPGISCGDYSALEAKLGVELPPSFKTWHSTYSFADANIGGLQLPAAPKSNPLSSLESCILETGISDEAVPMRILPFAWSEDAGRFLCFDAREAREDSEWPVVGLDHDLPFSEALKVAGRRHVAKSFLEFITNLVDTLEDLAEWSRRLQ